MRQSRLKVAKCFDVQFIHNMKNRRLANLRDAQQLEKWTSLSKREWNISEFIMCESVDYRRNNSCKYKTREEYAL